MKGLVCGNGSPDERDGEREVGLMRGTGAGGQKAGEECKG